MTGFHPVNEIMNLNYDPKTDSLYMQLRKGKYDRSKKISDGFLVDFDKDNKILGIEVLTVKEAIPSFVPGKTQMTFGSRLATA